MAKSIIRVLLVEDNPTDVLFLRDALDNHPLAQFQLTPAERLSQGLDYLRTKEFDAILLDLGLPDSQGLATFEQLYRQAENLPVVVLSGIIDEQIAIEAVQAGAQDYLVKGLAGWDLAPRAIRYAIERQQAEAALLAERASLAQRVKERTAELSQANAELAQALRAKDEFLANMSHELRTPLNAVLGMAEVLHEQVFGSLNERQIKSVMTIEQSGHHLLDLINDILDLAKVEAGKLELQPEKVSVMDVCQASLAFVNEMASKKNLRLSFHLNNPPTTVQADPRRLKQILVNLLSNAVKFTPAGGQVSLEVTPDATTDTIHFAVQDNGIGIAAADLDKLFKPFTQLDSSLSRQYEGSGLGLALIRRLTDLHGGSVGVESAGIPGQGSRFTVSLPWASPAEATAKNNPNNKANPLISQPAPALSPPPKNKKMVVLLAEDNELNRIAISDYLEQQGYQVNVAGDGGEALHLAPEIQPDIIVMDIQMPVLDGLQVTQHLRTNPSFTTTPIIALTALAMPGDRERCIAAGASEYLTKPVSLKGLAEMMSRLLGDKRETL